VELEQSRHRKKGPLALVERYSCLASFGFASSILGQICNKPQVDLWVEGLFIA